MTTRITTLLLAALVAVAVGAVAVGFGQAPPAANAAELGFTITVDKVIVNQSGGIQVQGTMDCTAAVEAVYPGLVGAPEQVLAGPNWDAYQYVGRTKVVHAAYQSAIARPCFIKDTPGPYPWYTVTPFPDSHPTWVYSADGKFVSGRIHVEAFGEGGSEIRTGQPPTKMADLYAWGQADLKAARAR